MSDSISTLEFVREILETVLLILERPVVWRQIVAFALVIVAAWVTRWLGRWLINQVVPHIPLATNDSDSTPKQLPEGSKVTASPAPGNEAKNKKSRGREHTVFQEVVHQVTFRLRAIHYTILPIICILWGQLAILAFQSNGWLFGLLERLVWLFWLALAYQIAVALLHSVLNAEHAKVYNRRFVTPLFLLFLIILASGADGGTFSTREMVLFRLLDADVTIGRLFTALLAFYLFQAFAWIVRDIFENFILKAIDNARGVGHMVVGASYYAIVAMGILVALGIAGFSMSALAVIFGGLSVGIGFGLQDLVANFISGILLLFGQTLQPGDVVEIGGKRGTVEKMSIRATVVRGVDNVETFVPNKTLLTSQFSTYNYTSPISRHALRIGVSYDNDPGAIRDILVELAARHGLVLKKPSPVVFLTDFGESALEFELAVHLDKPARSKEVLSDLRYMIWQEFRKQDIEIPFPQRDVYLREPGLRNTTITPTNIGHELAAMEESQ